MSYMDLFKVPEPARELSGKAAVVGVGESDYRADYQAARAKTPGYQGQTAQALATVAFERALADSGLCHDEIDGLSVAFLYGGPTAAEQKAFQQDEEIKAQRARDAAATVKPPAP